MPGEWIRQWSVNELHFEFAVSWELEFGRCLANFGCVFTYFGELNYPETGGHAALKAL